MLDVFLLFSLGFFGSFGHCVGMCGPLTAAFSLSQTKPQSAWVFHLLLNLGRLISYVLVGAAIGALGSVLIAGGEMAGVGSGLRRAMSLITGGLLMGVGLAQLGLLPQMPHPLMKGHEWLSRVMVQLSFQNRSWMPLALGVLWGLIPCGFLYSAQIKAAETGSGWGGGISLLAFGLGTLPTMLGIGVSTARLSRDRRSQLFRLGGGVTLLIGLITLLRTGDTMVDYTGHGSLFCLILALAARPISRLWPAPLRYRRLLGVGAFVLAIAHTLHMVEHSWGWNFDAVFFMLPAQQWAIGAGLAALLLLLPAAVTSFDFAQQGLGRHWRSLHLLAIPALILSVGHCIAIGSHYLGAMPISGSHQVLSVGLGAIALLTLAMRMRWLWSLLSLENYYVAPVHIRSSLPAQPDPTQPRSDRSHADPTQRRP